MKVDRMKELAELEPISILYVRKAIKAIIKARQEFPTGKDLIFRADYIPLIETYCDRVGIPLYVVSLDGCVSTAKTYALLLLHEKER